MFIDIDHQQVRVPQEIVKYCDWFTLDAKRDDLRYIDCVHMHLGLYGNDLKQLEHIRSSVPIRPVF